MSDRETTYTLVPADEAPFVHLSHDLDEVSDNEEVLNGHLAVLRKQIDGEGSSTDGTLDAWLELGDDSLSGVGGDGKLPNEDEIKTNRKKIIKNIIFTLVSIVVLTAALGGSWYAYRTYGPGKLVSAPDLIGLGQVEALRRITDAGLVVGVVIEQTASGIDAGLVLDQKPRVDTRVNRGSKIDITISVEGATISVPSIEGITVAEATLRLTEERLTVKEIPTYSDTAVEGQIVGQLPVSQTLVKKGAAVYVLVSKGALSTPKNVPLVIGMEREQADKIMRDTGFIPQIFEASAAFGTLDRVVAQTPASSTSVLPGTPVQVLISRGSSTTDELVPEVVGMTQENAQSTLQEAGYHVTVTQTTDVDAAIGTIIGQMPISTDTMMRAGDTIGLLVSRGPSMKQDVPDVLGVSIQTAVARLRQAGLEAIVVTEDGSDYHLSNLVTPSAEGQQSAPEQSDAIRGQDMVTQQFPAGALQYQLGLPVLIYVGVK